VLAAQRRRSPAARVREDTFAAKLTASACRRRGRVQRGVSLASCGGLHHPPRLTPPRPIALSRPTTSRKPQGQCRIERQLSLSARDGTPPLLTPPPNHAPFAPVRCAAYGAGYVTHPPPPIHVQTKPACTRLPLRLARLTVCVTSGADWQDSLTLWHDF
jgi:hypothetical protein